MSESTGSSTESYHRRKTEASQRVSQKSNKVKVRFSACQDFKQGENFTSSKLCKKILKTMKCIFNVLENPQFKVTEKSYGDVIGPEEGSTPPDSPLFMAPSFS